MKRKILAFLNILMLLCNISVFAQQTSTMIDFSSLDLVSVDNSSMFLDNGRLISKNTSGICGFSINDIIDYADFEVEVKVALIGKSSDNGGFVAINYPISNGKQVKILISENGINYVKDTGFEETLIPYKIKLNTDYTLKINVINGYTTLYLKNSEQSFEYIGVITDTINISGRISAVSYNYKASFDYIKYSKIDVIDYDEIFYNDVLSSPNFSDDFQCGGGFWNLNNQYTLQNGTLYNNNTSGISSTYLNAQPKNWVNYTMKFDFRWLDNYEHDSAFFGINLRQDQKGSGLLVIVKKTGVNYVYPNQLEDVIGQFNFLDKTTYTMEITAENENVSIKVKKKTDDVFTNIGNVRVKVNAIQEMVGFSAYNYKIGIENFEMRNNEPNKIISRYNYPIPIGCKVNGKFPLGYTLKCVDEKIANIENGYILGKNIGNTVVEIRDAQSNIVEKIDISVYDQVKAIYFPTEIQELEVGQNLGITCCILPKKVADNSLLWSSDNESCVKIFGELSDKKTLLPLATGSATITVTSLKSGATKKIVVNVVPKYKKQNDSAVLEIDKMFNVPKDFFGVHSNDGESIVKSGRVVNKQEFIDNDNLNLKIINDLNLKNVRACGENYNWQTGGGYNQILPVGCAKYELSDVSAKATRANIAQVYSVSMRDTDDAIIQSVYKLWEINKNNGLYIELGNECYANYCIEQLPTIDNYINRCKILYPKIKAISSQIKVGIVILDKGFDIAVQNGTTVGNPDDPAYTESNRAKAWNEKIADVPFCYDAVIVHQYSGLPTMDYVSADDLMRHFFTYNAFMKTALQEQSTQFANKEFWITEYGDLPPFFWENSETEKNRMQTMKTVGNAVSYAERIFKMLESEKVAISSYHYLNDSQGFGIVQTDGQSIVKLPNYYMFLEIGRLLDLYKQSYKTKLLTANTQDEILRLNSVNQKVSVQDVNAWVFGNNNQCEEVAFQNTTNSPIEVTLKNYDIAKKWSYGGDSSFNNYMANTNYWISPPDNIKLPKTFSSSYANTIILEPYSITTANIKSNSDNLTKFDVTSTLNNKDLVPVNTQIHLVFSEMLKSDTIKDNIKLTCNGKNVSYTYQNSETNCIIKPTEILKYQSAYTVEFTDGLKSVNNKTILPYKRKITFSTQPQNTVLLDELDKWKLQNSVIENNMLTLNSEVIKSATATTTYKEFKDFILETDFELTSQQKGSSPTFNIRFRNNNGTMSQIYIALDGVVHQVMSNGTDGPFGGNENRVVKQQCMQTLRMEVIGDRCKLLVKDKGQETFNLVGIVDNVSEESGEIQLYARNIKVNLQNTKIYDVKKRVVVQNLSTYTPDTANICLDIMGSEQEISSFFVVKNENRVVRIVNRNFTLKDKYRLSQDVLIGANEKLEIYLWDNKATPLTDKILGE